LDVNLAHVRHRIALLLISESLHECNLLTGAYDFRAVKIDFMPTVREGVSDVPDHADVGPALIADNAHGVSERGFRREIPQGGPGALEQLVSDVRATTVHPRQDCVF
jgi:hypothetical protein